MKGIDKNGSSHAKKLRKTMLDKKACDLLFLKEISRLQSNHTEEDSFFIRLISRCGVSLDCVTGMRHNSLRLFLESSGVLSPEVSKLKFYY